MESSDNTEFFLILFFLYVGKFDSIFRRNFTQFSSNHHENFTQFLSEVLAVSRRISFNFQENFTFISFLKKTFLNCSENFANIFLNLKRKFTQFLRKFYSIFNKISHNFQENFIQLFRELYSVFFLNFMYVVYLNARVLKNLCTQWTKI